MVPERKERLNRTAPDAHAELLASNGSACVVGPGSCVGYGRKLAHCIRAIIDDLAQSEGEKSDRSVKVRRIDGKETCCCDLNQSVKMI